MINNLFAFSLIDRMMPLVSYSCHWSITKVSKCSPCLCTLEIMASMISLCQFINDDLSILFGNGYKLYTTVRIITTIEFA